MQKYHLLISQLSIILLGITIIFLSIAPFDLWYQKNDISEDIVESEAH